MRSGVYFVQPNVCRVGGPTGMRRIMNLIDLNERVFAPHSWSSIICMTANMHLMATVRKHYMLEYDINPSAFREDLILEPYPFKQGTYEIPDRPGFGLELNTIAAKFMKARFEEVMNQTIYAYISDGGIQEEISQGAGRIAGALGLDNLIMFYDANDIQLSTETKDVTIEDTAKKYEAWGWKVITIDGNDADAIRGALNEAKTEAERPTLIIGHTVMGKGARKADGSSYEANCATHGAPLGGDAYVNTIKNLGGNPENPFTVFPEVAELYARRAAELKGIMAEKYAAKAAWAKANPEKAAKLELFFSGKAPEVDWTAIEQKANVATRAASATVLGALATQVENMIVASADLSNSDKTDGFLKKTHSFKKGDFSGS